jgi:ATP-dependent exoDNAse (exonuclease V) alpha subunit
MRVSTAEPVNSNENARGILIFGNDDLSDHGTQNQSRPVQGCGRSQTKIPSYDPGKRSNVSVFESQERAFAIGHRIQFTTPSKEKGIASRETAAIEQIEGNGNIAVRLETGRRVAWNLKEYKYLDHAYAMTSHSSQRMTVDRVLIHVDTIDSRVRGLVDKTLSYVATSRARYDAQVFTLETAFALRLELKK